MSQDLEALLQQIKGVYLQQEEALKKGNGQEGLGERDFQGFLKEYDEFYECQTLALKSLMD